MPRRPVLTQSQVFAAHTEWEWHFAQYEQVVSLHGHDALGQHPVAEWLRRQQAAALAGKLSASQRSRLSALGVRFRADYKTWDRLFQSLRDWREALPADAHEVPLPDPPAELHHWLEQQRDLAAHGLLLPDRRRRLARYRFLATRAATLGPSPDPQAWEDQFNQLEAFQRQHGHCDVPDKWPAAPRLKGWVSHQRQRFRQGKLPPERHRRLDALGFNWQSGTDKREAQWSRRYAELCAFHQQHGHTRVPRIQGVKGDLGAWRHLQRADYHKGLLKPDHQARLDAIGFEWVETVRRGAEGRKLLQVAADARWDARMARLRAFHQEHGHTLVPAKWAADRDLGRWVATQRELMREDKLLPQRRQQLESIGFLPQALLPQVKASHPEHYRQLIQSLRERQHFDALWQQRYEEMCAYQQQHGHTRVTKRQNKGLSAWRQWQCQRFRDGRLTPECRSKLEAIGFDWMSAKTRPRLHYAPWAQRLKELTTYRRRYGHVKVAWNVPQYRPLFIWLDNQRSLQRDGRLPPEHREALEALGVEFGGLAKRYAERWEMRYQEMCAFQQEHGHTRVPKAYDRSLYLWRVMQRNVQREGAMLPERHARLQAICFEW